MAEISIRSSAKLQLHRGEWPLAHVSPPILNLHIPKKEIPIRNYWSDRYLHQKWSPTWLLDSWGWGTQTAVCRKLVLLLRGVECSLPSRAGLPYQPVWMLNHFRKW